MLASRGSVIPLDRMSGDPADILANGRVIAKGELTVVTDEVVLCADREPSAKDPEQTATENGQVTWSNPTCW